MSESKHTSDHELWIFRQTHMPHVATEIERLRASNAEILKERDEAIAREHETDSRTLCAPHQRLGRKSEWQTARNGQ